MTGIRLFASDIDGCLTEPFAPFDLDLLAELRRLTRRGDGPAFTLCTGRPLGYAEAMAQLLDVRLPILFEAGAGMFDPQSGVRRWHPDFGGAEQEAIAHIQNWLEELTRGTGLAVDRGKFTQAGLIGAETAEIEAATGPVERYVEEKFPDFTVAHTPISIDIMHRGLTKREGLTWLAGELGIPLEATAFIGDTNGDIGALGVSGASFAPANASPEVKKLVGTVTTGRFTASVLEAYSLCTAPPP